MNTSSIELPLSFVSLRSNFSPYHPALAGSIPETIGLTHSFSNLKVNPFIQYLLRSLEGHIQESMAADTFQFKAKAMSVAGSSSCWGYFANT